MNPRNFVLVEHVPSLLPRDALSMEEGTLLLREHDRQVCVEFPSPRTGDAWELTALGWVGHLPVTQALSLTLQPKISLSNLFGMLEYAFHHDIRFLDGTVPCETLQEVYERIALLLARRILDRGRRGFFRAYVRKEERLPYIRGRVDVRAHARSSWDVAVPCLFENHVSDIDDNQILAWTLQVILQSRFCRNETTNTIRRAYRELQSLVTPVPCPAEACLRRAYHSLNADYRAMHGLCYFFLAHSGPGHGAGSRSMLPFLVEMPRLFERFTAEWLRAHLPEHVALKSQENVPIDGSGLRFAVDLVLSDRRTGRPLLVLDTKYKRTDAPSYADIYQAHAYASALRCDEAILIYPAPLRQPLDARIGGIRLRSAAFRLDGDLESAGQDLLRQLNIHDR